ncbi:MAG TPA: hypothetical protein VMU50_05635 [Polyangia bacterium]|nr:hypothetical protein [Polyangia bacterium]
MKKSIAWNLACVSPAAPLPLAAILLVAAGGCYNPNIANGGFSCAVDAGKSCPDGFYCHSSGRCYKPDTGPVDCGSTALCAEQPGLNQECSLACQTGCGCGQRCNVTKTGPRCVGAPSPAKALGEVCQLTNGGVQGFDDCAPGLVCLGEMCGKINRCYRLCSSDAQCGAGISCSIPVNTQTSVLGFNPKVCDVPRQDCDPIAQTGCPSGLTCYLLNDGNTLCDCPSSSASAEGGSCVLYYDCKASLTCVASAGSSAACRSICATASSTCAMGTTCKAIGASTKFGNCQP